jgi:hypothetical protein
MYLSSSHHTRSLSLSYSFSKSDYFRPATLCFIVLILFLVQSVCSIPQFQQMASFLVTFVTSILPDGGKYLEEIGEEVNDWYFPTGMNESILLTNLSY